MDIQIQPAAPSRGLYSPAEETQVGKDTESGKLGRKLGAFTGNDLFRTGHGGSPCCHLGACARFIYPGGFID